MQALPIVNALARFLRWWGTELSALVPVWLRTWWSGENRIVLFSLEAGQPVFHTRAHGQYERLQTEGLDRANTSARALTRELARHVGSDFSLYLSVPDSQVLRRTLTLPLAVEENLRQTLSFELDRLTPFRPEQAHFGFRILDRDVKSCQFRVDLAVARKSDVEASIKSATALGFPIEGIAFGRDVLEGTAIHPSQTSKHDQTSMRLRWRIGAIILALLLTIILLAIPIWQKRSAAIALQSPLTQAKDSAHEADTLRERLDRLEVEHNFLINKKWGGQSILVTLDELSKRLKDDTYISLFEFDGKTVTINGESSSAASLVELLEASPVFRNVAFKAPLTKHHGTAFDRFHIGFELRPEAIPKPPANDAASPIATPVPEAAPSPPSSAASSSATAPSAPLSAVPAPAASTPKGGAGQP